MKKETTLTLRQPAFLIGIGLIALSAGIFLIPWLFNFGNDEDSNLGIFILNYIISIVYFMIVLNVVLPKFNINNLRDNVEYGFIHMVLCLISAFSLNRIVPVFEESTLWLQYVLVIQSILLIMSHFVKSFSPLVRFIYWVMLGVMFSLFLYFAAYIAPIYVLSLVLLPGFGVSLHAFVPLMIVTMLLFFLSREDNRNRQNIMAFSMGIVVSVLFIAGYVYYWDKADRIIVNATNKSLMDEKNDLPEWCVIAQELPKNSFSEKILKTSIVYSVPENDWLWFDFNFPGRGFDEVRRHDPLVMISCFILGKPNITDDQKIKILESMYDSRHQAQERLWSGENLQTRNILTNVRLYPSLRMSYTEKFITVRNNGNVKRWNNSEEAIYTFHLPEGAIVTSLSLWINGKEEKAVLTEKNKADTAYRTIVGVESHDPSLVRWQEGNTVSVRVFPCTPKEDRRFKIGFTTPLRAEDNKIIYDNIWFDGPSSVYARESIRIQTMDDVSTVEMPSGFKSDVEEGNSWTYNGMYKQDWSIKIPATPVVSNAFSFDGKSYSINEYSRTYEGFNPQNVFIDVNKQWTRNEWDRVIRYASGKDVYVYLRKKIRVTPENESKLFGQLTKNNFSVFPLYEIQDPENSLLITKGTTASPNLSDLNDSDFALKLRNYVSSHGKIRLFNLNSELSPYMKTLKELRVFSYDSGDMNYLGNLISDKKFVVCQENQNTVVINDSAIKITESDGETVSNAPDHLMRLFSYNNVMYMIGTKYFDSTAFDQAIVDKAYKAYVVSPVTSLVVLETQEDYDRFKIADKGNSLKNASMKSSGSVPEPHEWLLIAILAGTVAFLYYKRKKSSAIHNF
jgi:XrtN system VIT domain protein